jgi:hypothetical protein
MVVPKGELQVLLSDRVVHQNHHGVTLFKFSLFGLNERVASSQFLNLLSILPVTKKAASASRCVPLPTPIYPRLPPSTPYPTPEACGRAERAKIHRTEEASRMAYL